MYVYVIYIAYFICDAQSYAKASSFQNKNRKKIRESCQLSTHCIIFTLNQPLIYASLAIYESPAIWIFSEKGVALRL